jgi:hypothetical protein
MPVQLITRDDGSRASLTRNDIANLFNQDHVDVLIGPYSSHLTKATLEICEANKRILWNHGRASDDIFHAKPKWVVSTISPPSKYLHNLPKCIAQKDRCRDMLSAELIKRYAFLLTNARRIYTSSLTSRISVVARVNGAWENENPVFSEFASLQALLSTALNHLRKVLMIGLLVRVGSMPACVQD